MVENVSKVYDNKLIIQQGSRGGHTGIIHCQVCGEGLNECVWCAKCSLWPQALALPIDGPKLTSAIGMNANDVC